MVGAFGFEKLVMDWDVWVWEETRTESVLILNRVHQAVAGLLFKNSQILIILLPTLLHNVH